MLFGNRILQRGMKGKDITELQMRLAGFRGTIWDGIFGPGTELQVITFKRDYMGETDPDGIVNERMFDALKGFTNEYPINFGKLKCECGRCGGFGQGRFYGKYEKGKIAVEAFYRYEYPGIHKAILHSYRALWFYSLKLYNITPVLTCGYRCWIRNEQKQRTSTNHLGKAIDIDFPLFPGEDKRDDYNRCNTVRGLMVEKGNFQIGWGANNKKAFEPAEIAPTWLHIDVRCFVSSYLNDSYFVKSNQELDSLEINQGEE